MLPQRLHSKSSGREHLAPVQKSSKGWLSHRLLVPKIHCRQRSCTLRGSYLNI